MDGFLELPGWLARWSAGPGLAIAVRVLHGILFLGLIAVILTMLRLRPPGRATHPVGYRRCTALLAAAFAGLLTYQASWQLAGFSRPRLLEFMRRYNHRPDSSLARPQRGRILDRRGRPLAENDPAQPDRRRYPAGAACAPLIGYLDPLYGRAGLESVEDPRLAGGAFDGLGDVGRYVRGMVNHRQVRGEDVILTLDAEFQQAAYDALQGRRGAVVALRPGGELLALVSSPSYAPETLAETLSRPPGEDRPLFNRALNGLYPPGSVAKILIAAAALEAGFDGRFDCLGEGFAPARGARPIRDHEYYVAQREGRAWGGHGRLDLRRAFARSSNVFFAQLGLHLGAEQLTAAASRTGFNAPWTVHRGSGGVLASQSSRWPSLAPSNRREIAQVSIGQGQLLMTPLHAALLAAAVARGGGLPSPRLTARDAAGTAGRLCSPAAAARLRDLMRAVMEDSGGTGRPGRVEGLEIAGKTGTAQAPGGDDHSWFVCFAPAAEPRLALAVLVEHGGYGSRAALPVAVQLLKFARDRNWFEDAAPVAPPPAPPAEEGAHG